MSIAVSVLYRLKESSVFLEKETMTRMRIWTKRGSVLSLPAI